MKIRYDESELIALLKQNNAAAFESIYDKYAPALYTVVLQIVRNIDVAENVLQKVFMIVLNKVNEYDSEKETFFIWMLKIARNAALNEIKSSGSETISQNTTPGEKGYSFLPNQEIDNFGLKKIIYHLADDQKEIVTLYYYKGFSIGQIANILSKSENFVRTTINSALSELRTLLIKNS